MQNYSIDSNAIDADEADYLYVKLSQINEAGNGLFTAIDIYKDEIIAVFDGEKLTPAQSVVRADAGQDQYFISMLDGSILDSKKTECFAKYANDAGGSTDIHFKNNAKIALNESNKVCLLATRKIKLGEEIFCGYGKSYWKKHG